MKNNILLLLENKFKMTQQMKTKQTKYTQAEGEKFVCKMKTTNNSNFINLHLSVKTKNVFLIRMF